MADNEDIRGSGWIGGGWIIGELCGFSAVNSGWRGFAMLGRGAK